MYALKQPKPIRQPQRTSRVSPQARSRKRSHPHRAIAYETTAKLVVNLVLSVAAISALVQLLPYRAAQEGKVQELEAAVKSTDRRVQGVQARFQNFFDPYQARENMQDLTDRIDPLRRRVIWKAPATPPVKTQPPVAPKN
ncbi:MAG: hypothetical protein IGS48_20915 [Oscillatoriales cyanobacterium C42_A2020_001]|nr:hypothetical protein [Leptolyngbyaceae cyanobacterium C42_A2020_001]